MLHLYTSLATENHILQVLSNLLICPPRYRLEMKSLLVNTFGDHMVNGKKLGVPFFVGLVRRACISCNPFGLANQIPSIET